MEYGRRTSRNMGQDKIFADHNTKQAMALAAGPHGGSDSLPRIRGRGSQRAYGHGGRGGDVRRRSQIAGATNKALRESSQYWQKSDSGGCGQTPGLDGFITDLLISGNIGTKMRDYVDSMDPQAALYVFAENQALSGVDGDDGRDDPARRGGIHEASIRRQDRVSFKALRLLIS